MPFSLMIRFLASAVSSAPPTIAPAWPMVRPLGAVSPAIKPITGLRLPSAFTHLAASASSCPPISPIIMIGEIGGQLEADAAKWVKADGNRKPVIGFIAGETAPKGRTMGHAGAIVGGADDTAEAKKRIMRENGIHV